MALRSLPNRRFEAPDRAPIPASMRDFRLTGGLRVLLVEDEALNIIHVEDLLADLGHTVVEVATTMADGVEAARLVDVDLAVLDLNLAGTMSFPVAQALERRGVPFFFLTAYGRWGLEEAYEGVAVVTKPMTRTALQNAIRQTLGS
ncbi:response regulator [Chthonobacter rhizosphaerae]|uniref:response regulator n=1 Tax=Chthonobacter rhizosphaerae TaxID=2735553 RepID=UPI001AEE34EE|nr:response regulator [Chthonobacter rhizosphaerae]